MKVITTLLLLVTALVLPSHASQVNSWQQIDVPGHNLTLNYTASFDISRNDTIKIFIRNMGTVPINDSITINKIDVSDKRKAYGTWAGSAILAPATSKTIDFIINVTADEAGAVDVLIYYNASSDMKNLIVTAFYPGAVGEYKKKNATVLTWYPQVIDNVYVNETESEMIEYTLTTAEPMIDSIWSLDGMPAEGGTSGNTSSYTHIWDNGSVGFHTVLYRGNKIDSQTEFRWYVNVYATGEGDGGSVFDLLNEALENELLDIKIRIFKDQISKYGDSGDFIAQKVDALHEEIATRQRMRDALRQEFKEGNITIEEYVAVLKMAQREAKYNIKFMEEMAEFARIELKNENLSREFENISMTENKNK